MAYLTTCRGLNPEGEQNYLLTALLCQNIPNSYPKHKTSPTHDFWFNTHDIKFNISEIIAFHR